MRTRAPQTAPAEIRPRPGNYRPRDTKAERPARCLPARLKGQTNPRVVSL